MSSGAVRCVFIDRAVDWQVTIFLEIPWKTWKVTIRGKGRVDVGFLSGKVAARVRRRCGLTSNYFGQLLLHARHDVCMWRSRFLLRTRCEIKSLRHDSPGNSAKNLNPRFVCPILSQCCQQSINIFSVFEHNEIFANHFSSYISREA